MIRNQLSETEVSDVLSHLSKRELACADASLKESDMEEEQQNIPQALQIGVRRAWTF